MDDGSLPEQLVAGRRAAVDEESLAQEPVIVDLDAAEARFEELLAQRFLLETAGDIFAELGMVEDLP